MQSYRTFWGENTPAPPYYLAIMELVRLAAVATVDDAGHRELVNDVRKFALEGRHLLNGLHHAKGSRYWDETLWPRDAPSNPQDITEKLRLVWTLAKGSPAKRGLADYHDPRQHRMFIHQEACFGVVQDLVAMHGAFLRAQFSRFESVDAPRTHGWQ